VRASEKKAAGNPAGPGEAAYFFWAISQISWVYAAGSAGFLITPNYKAMF
jgi:hypothetical protein